MLPCGFFVRQIKNLKNLKSFTKMSRCCNGPIQYKDFKAVKEDTRILTKVGITIIYRSHDRHLLSRGHHDHHRHCHCQAMESHKPVDGAFLTAASPGVVALFQVPLLVRGQVDEEDEVDEDDEDDAEDDD